MEQLTTLWHFHITEYYIPIKNMYSYLDLDQWLLCILRGKKRKWQRNMDMNDQTFLKMNEVRPNDWSGFKEWQLEHSWSFTLITYRNMQRHTHDLGHTWAGVCVFVSPFQSLRKTAPVSSVVSCEKCGNFQFTRFWNKSPLPFQILRLEEGPREHTRAHGSLTKHYPEA